MTTSSAASRLTEPDSRNRQRTSASRCRKGYRVRTDVTYTLGYEDVHWDLAFDGPVSGTMARDTEFGVVFVVVNPPGQPAIAGE